MGPINKTAIATVDIKNTKCGYTEFQLLISLILTACMVSSHIWNC
jgi:hypothetical protein